MRTEPRLLLFCGLPGAGKTTLSRGLAAHLHAVLLRIDAIDRGLRRSALALTDTMDGAYVAARELASENLAVGGSVVIDGVHWQVAQRAPWLEVAPADAIRWIEVTCDEAIRQGRIEARPQSSRAAMGSLKQNWRMDPVVAPKIVIDTTTSAPEDALAELIARVDVARLDS